MRIAAAALVFAVMLAAFSGLAVWAAKTPKAEFAPALLRSCAAFSLGALATVVVIVFLTWLFGRFYCACLCPLGIWQDLVGYLSRRKGRIEKDRPIVRYIIAGVTFGVLAAGWVLPFLLLDPYSNFGRAASHRCMWGGLVPIVIVTLLAVWRKRLFCTVICPVGTLLGLFSRYGLFKVRFTASCVKCGLCVKSCPSGCIDPKAGTIDNERCVRCLNCLAECRLAGVEFSTGRKSPVAEAAAPDKSRRTFLIRGGVLLAGLAAGFAAARSGAVRAVGKVLAGAKNLILPPGAGDAERFAKKCTACQLCTVNCPSKVIVPAPGGDGPVRLNFANGGCKYDCGNCSSVCPTGAIRPLALEEKRRTRIGLVKFSAARCVVCRTKAPCGKCEAACPTGAINLKGDPGAPKVDARLCIGCGACQAACPASPKAMEVLPVEKQTRLPDSVELLPTPKPAILPPGAGDAERFVANCAGCGICVANCSGKVIKPISGGDGTVHVDLSQGSCQYHCNKCSTVCPTGAIKPLTLEEKQHTKIAEAAFDPKVCLVFQNGEKCGKCAAACPTGAIRLRKNGTPRPVDRALCIGCGACQAACPASPRAMTVHPIEKQSSTS